MASIAEEPTPSGIGAQNEFPTTRPVPESAKTYRSIDMFLIWLGFNANTGSWFIGGLAASLGLGGALGVILFVNPPAYILVAAIGYMAFRVGTTTYGLARPSLGIRGAGVASALNFVQYTGWAVVDTAIGAIALSFVFAGLFGWAPFGTPGAESTLAVGITLLAILQAIPVIVAGHRSIQIAARKYGVASHDVASIVGRVGGRKLAERRRGATIGVKAATEWRDVERSPEDVERCAPGGTPANVGTSS